MHVELEFLVEPFKEGQPGSHVTAALEAVDAAGLEVDMGAFATSTNGEITVVARAVHDLILAAMSEGASRLQIQVSEP
jgi:uncharacterized protein YqgV (UPF0045/DUF77 family)